MLCSQALEQLLDRRGEALIGTYLGHPCRVPPSRGDLQEGQYGDGRRLMLVRDIRVIAGCRQARGSPLGTV